VIAWTSVGVKARPPTFPESGVVGGGAAEELELLPQAARNADANAMVTNFFTVSPPGAHDIG
jgi:hypothetical protein